MKLLNSIYYKSLIALYKLNIDKDGRAKSIIIDAIFQGLVIQKDGLNLALLEMAIDTATEDWLDYWGNVFGVLRDFEEKDDDYRKRIVEEILAPKSTNRALTNAATRYIKKNNPEADIKDGDIRIFEPWTRLIKCDSRGYIDGPGRLVSYEYWNYGVVDISISDSSLISKGLIEYLKKIKAGGVQITFSVSPAWDIVEDLNKEDNKYNILKRIHRYTYIYPIEPGQAFKSMIDGASSKVNDSSFGSLIDQRDLLDGNIKVFWSGPVLERSIMATGPIRNHLGSPIASLLSYENIGRTYLKKTKDLTIEEAIQLEKDSFFAERLDESYLTENLSPIEQKTSLISKDRGLYVSFYQDKDGFNFDQDNILDYASLEEIASFDTAGNLSLDDFALIFNEAKILDPRTSKSIKIAIKEHMEDKKQKQEEILIKNIK